MEEEPTEANLAKTVVNILRYFKFAMLDGNNGECQFQQNTEQTGLFYDQ